MNSYKTILKTTGLFASLRVLSILVNIATSKMIAVFVGVSGIGLYGLYTSALSFITTIADLGVSKSSVRNIAVSEGTNDKSEVEKTISIVSRLIFVTGTIGAIVTILCSYQISQWSFGSGSYWISFVLLGLCVFFTIVKNGQTAIFQGLRRYKLITRVTINSSLLTLIISAPIIYFFKEQGIIYVILLGAIIGFIVTSFYLRDVEYKVLDKKYQLTKSNSLGLIKLGLSMMLVSFLVAFSGYVIRAYINTNGSSTDLGNFQAGFQIISGYFGLIFTSMTTDYFPRISSIQDDNAKLNLEVNQQATITLLLICPLVVILPFIMPLVIQILYSSKFTSTVEYVNYAIFGIIFQAGSQTMGMILLAKNNAKVYTITVLLFQVFFLFLNILGYNLYGVIGLGITFSINMFLHIVGMQIINYSLYRITFSKEFYLTFGMVLALAILSNLAIHLTGPLLYGSCLVLFGVSVFYVIYRLKKLLNITSFVALIKKKLNGKSKKDT